MAFPTSPTDGQVAQQNGIYYTYASATGSWTRKSIAGAIFSVVTDTVYGDGTTYTYLLSITPVNSDVVSVNIDGVLQQKSAYTIASNMLAFTGVPVNGAVIEIRTVVASAMSALTGLVYNSYTGDGTTAAFTLSTTPTSKNYTIVSIGGIAQNKATYSVSGTTLTFSAAPPNTAPIEVTTFGPAITTATAAGANTQIQFSNGSGLAASSNLTFDLVTSTLTAPNINATNITVNNAPVTAVSKAVGYSLVFGG